MQPRNLAAIVCMMAAMLFFSGLPGIAMAYICSYECTFCSNCSTHMHLTCPNCGGELTRRPTRIPKDVQQAATTPSGEQIP